jgi:hypothetical protein
MHWPRETLIQLYLEGGLSPEAHKEFNRLSRKDPAFSNEVTEAVQNALRHLGEPVSPAKVPDAPARAVVLPSWKPFLSKFRPWIGLALMGLAALGAVFLLVDWARQVFKAKPLHARIARAPEKSGAVPGDKIRQMMVQALLTPAVGEEAIGVSPSLSAAGKELVFHEGDRIYLSIESPQQQSVILSVLGPEGALIRRLYEGEWQPGVHQIDWDGRDASGRPVPPGRYSVVLKAGGKTMSDRLLIQPAS